MGFLSSLAKLGGAIAAPFTGGASLALSALGGIGDVMGSSAAGAANQRAGENQQATNLYNAQSQNYGTQQSAILNLLNQMNNMQMERAQFGATSPQNYAQNALMGDRLANAQKVTISHPRANIPTISGGFDPSMWSQNTRDLGREMSTDALARMRQAPQMQQAGWLEKLLGYGGLAGGLLGSLPNPSTTKTTMPGTYVGPY